MVADGCEEKDNVIPPFPASLKKLFMKKIIPLAGMLCAFFCANSQTKNFIDQPYIEVAGYADTMVTPNEIFIQIMLSERDTRDRMSIEDLEQKMTTALTKIGLDIEKDLTTSDMMSNYKYYLLWGSFI
jgi:uncharacterized protein YggE